MTNSIKILLILGLLAVTVFLYFAQAPWVYLAIIVVVGVYTIITAKSKTKGEKSS